MTTPTSPEIGIEPHTKTLAQFKQELDALAQEHRGKSIGLERAGRKGKADAKRGLADTTERIAALEEEACITLSDKDWEEFLRHLHTYIDLRRIQSPARTIDVHRRSFGKRLADASEDVAMGTAEIAGHGVKAATTFTAKAAEHLAAGTILTIGGIIKGSGKAIQHLLKQEHRKAA